MIEISMTEMVLFAWGVLATGSWLTTKNELAQAKHIMWLFIKNKDVREQMLKAYEESKDEDLIRSR